MRPRGIDDGNGEPVAEAIVGRAAVVGLDEKTGVEELRFAESAFDESPLSAPPSRSVRSRCETLSASAGRSRAARRSRSASRPSRVASCSSK